MANKKDKKIKKIHAQAIALEQEVEDLDKRHLLISISLRQVQLTDIMTSYPMLNVPNKSIAANIDVIKEQLEKQKRNNVNNQKLISDTMARYEEVKKLALGIQAKNESKASQNTNKK